MGLCVWLVWPEATEYDCKHLHTHGIRWTMISIQVQLIFLVCVCVLDGEEEEEEGEQRGLRSIRIKFSTDKQTYRPIRTTAASN